jgi:biotin transporter BioY
MQLGFIALLIQRLKSEQPEFYKKLQVIAIIVLLVVGAVWFVLWLGVWQVAPELHAKLNTACYAVATFIVGVFFTAATGTKDPNLISKDVKDAVVKDAAGK